MACSAEAFVRCKANGSCRRWHSQIQGCCSPDSSSSGKMVVRTLLRSASAPFCRRLAVRPSAKPRSSFDDVSEILSTSHMAPRRTTCMWPLRRVNCRSNDDSRLAGLQSDRCARRSRSGTVPGAEGSDLRYQCGLGQRSVGEPPPAATPAAAPAYPAAGSAAQLSFVAEIPPST